MYCFDLSQAIFDSHIYEHLSKVTTMRPGLRQCTIIDFCSLKILAPQTGNQLAIFTQLQQHVIIPTSGTILIKTIHHALDVTSTRVQLWPDSHALQSASSYKQTEMFKLLTIISNLSLVDVLLQNTKYLII